LKKAADDAWDDDKLEQFLAKRNFPEELVSAFVAVWAGESDHVRYYLLVCWF
jgi:hypothetical protein